MTDIVTVNWLNKNLTNNDLILLDASLESTVQGEKVINEQQTIPSARFFDLKHKFSDSNSPFPNTVPSAKQFESACQELGINKNSQIVVFDNRGIYSSPRVWWLFKSMGHENISVLDGGLPEWIKQGFQTTNREVLNYPIGDFQATFLNENVKSYEEVLENLQAKSFVIVDARSEGRFKGTAKEPRKHLKSGHIPNSANIPFQKVLNGNTFKPAEELKELFNSTGIDAQEMVFSCGSGLTACIVMLAGQIANHKNKYLYDGSWTEWARQKLIIKEKED